MEYKILANIRECTIPSIKKDISNHNNIQPKKENTYDDSVKKIKLIIIF